MAESFAPGDFLGLDGPECAYERARAVFLPVPYEKTTTYRKGTGDGPRALVEASKQVEFFDETLEEETFRRGIHTHPGVGGDDPPERFTERLREAAARLVADGKLVGAAGGEHSISLGLVEGHLQRYPGLTVLHFDAHGDLRDSYEGTRYGHGCVMRRVAAHAPIVQVGIRSLSAEEAAFAREGRVRTYFAYRSRRDPRFVESVLDGLGREVYVSIDLDAFDPSECPGVGTPEPGGLGWYDVVGILERVAAERRIVGFDVVELRPLPDTNHSEFLAAKLCYRLFGLALRSRERSEGGGATEVPR
jgi:agmatinase